MKKRIYCETVVTDIATYYYLDTDMARDSEINLSFVPTAVVLTDCFTKPLPKPTFVKLCATMRMTRIGLGNSLGMYRYGWDNGNRN
jgi:hypothetical protein